MKDIPMEEEEFDFASVFSEDTTPDATVTPDAPTPPADTEFDFSSVFSDDFALDQPAALEDDGLTLGETVQDAAAAFGMGAGGLAGGMGQIADWLGAEDTAESLKRIGQSAVSYYQNMLSDEAKAEMDKEFVTTKEGGKWYNPLDWVRPEDAAGIYAAFLMGMESLPATAVGMGVGGKIGAGLYKVANSTKTLKAFGAVAEKGAKTAAQVEAGVRKATSTTEKLISAGKKAERIQKLVGGTTGAIGYGAGEAIPAAGMAGMQVEDDIQARDHEFLHANSKYYRDFFAATEGLGMTMDEREKTAKDNLADLASSKAGLEAGLYTFAAGAPMGVLSAHLFNKAMPALFKGGKFKGALVEGGGEAAQEFVQSGAEQYVSNMAIKEYADPTKRASEGVINAAVGGAVSGAGMGVSMGMVGTPTKARTALLEKAQTDAKKVQDDVYVLEGLANNAMNGLVETHGMTQQEALKLIDPILEKFSDVDQNILAAGSDLSHLEKTGKPRDTGVPDKGTLDDLEYPVVIETQKGETRKHEDGETVMQTAYGALSGTVGADGDPIDVFASDTGDGIWVIEKTNDDGTFDEHKVMLGFATEEEALDTFYRNYDQTIDRVRAIQKLNVGDFNRWASATTAQYMNQAKVSKGYDFSAIEDEFFTDVLPEIEVEPEQDALPTAALTPEVAGALREAGATRNFKTAAGESYEGVSMPDLWMERTNRLEAIQAEEEGVPRETPETGAYALTDKEDYYEGHKGRPERRIGRINIARWGQEVDDKGQKVPAQIRLRKRPTTEEEVVDIMRRLNFASFSTEINKDEAYDMLRAIKARPDLLPWDKDNMPEIFRQLKEATGGFRKTKRKGKGSRTAGSIQGSVERGWGKPTRKSGAETPANVRYHKRPKTIDEARAALGGITTDTTFMSAFTEREQLDLMEAVGLKRTDVPPDEDSAAGRLNAILAITGTPEKTFIRHKGLERRWARDYDSDGGQVPIFIQQNSAPKTEEDVRRIMEAGDLYNAHQFHKLLTGGEREDLYNAAGFDFSKIPEAPRGSKEGQHRRKARALFERIEKRGLAPPRPERTLIKLAKAQRWGQAMYAGKPVPEAVASTEMPRTKEEVKAFLAKLETSTDWDKGVITAEKYHVLETAGIDISKWPPHMSGYHKSVLSWKVLKDAGLTPADSAVFAQAVRNLPDEAGQLPLFSLSKRKAEQAEYRQEKAAWQERLDAFTAKQAKQVKGWVEQLTAAGASPEEARGWLDPANYEEHFYEHMRNKFPGMGTSAKGRAPYEWEKYDETDILRWETGETTIGAERQKWLAEVVRIAMDRLQAGQQIELPLPATPQKGEQITLFSVVSEKEDARRKKASERMTRINKERAKAKWYILKTILRDEWSAVESTVDASAAGATTFEEFQDAITEWIMNGVSSKYFKRWFGESATVDAGGVPLRFFHGTDQDIYEFYAKKGFVSLSLDPDFASKFAQTFSENPTVYSLYVKADKIFDFRNAKMRRSLKRWIKNTFGGIDLKHQQLLDRVASGDWSALENRTIQTFMKGRNYDAFWMRENEVLNMGVFNPLNIKSATGNIGTFLQQTGRIGYALTPNSGVEVFESAIERWIDKSFAGKRLKTIELLSGFTTPKGLGKKGISAEEVADMGLGEWLQEKATAKQEYITKTEFMDFVRANKVIFTEVERRSGLLALGRGTYSDFGIPAAEMQLYDVRRMIQQAAVTNGMAEAEAIEITNDFENLGFSALYEVLSATEIATLEHKWDLAQMDLHQAQQHHDIMVSGQTGDQYEVGAGATKFQDFTLFGGAYPAHGTAQGMPTVAIEPTYRELLLKIPRRATESRDFRTHHWDHRNVLLHVRLWIKTDEATQTKTLMVEEIQSDWNQEAQDVGYGEGGVPEGAMASRWRSTAIKRLIRYAVDAKVDEIAWTSGEVQRDRYDLSGLYHKIEMNKVGEDQFTLRLTPTTFMGQYSGEEPQTTAVMDRQLVQKHLTVELTNKLLSRMDAAGYATLEGVEEISWEGKSIMALYDFGGAISMGKIIRKYLNTIDPKAEIKLKTFHVFNQFEQRAKAHKMWTFPVSETLQNTIGSSPQTMYSIQAQEEIGRRIELYQLRAYITKHTTSRTTSRALKNRLIEGANRGFYSSDILRTSGMLKGKLSRDLALKKIAMQSGPEVTTRTSLPKRVIQQELVRILEGWKRPVDFIVHESWRTFPASVLGEVLQHDLKPEGFLDPFNHNLIHINAENISTMEQLHSVFAEEALGHHGLRAFFEDIVGDFTDADGTERAIKAEIDELMDSILPDIENSPAWHNLLQTYTHVRDGIAAAEKGIKKAVDAGREPPPELLEKLQQWKRSAAEEILVQQDLDQSVLDKVIAKVRAWLRAILHKAGFRLNWTDNDMKRVLAKIHTHVLNGDTPHPWGRRNHVPTTFADGMQYNLYGGVMDSALLDAIMGDNTQKSLQPKSKPKNILDQLRGDDGAPTLWRHRTAKSAEAAKAMGFREDELDMSGLLPWLRQQYVEQPNKSITNEEVAAVFRATAPQVQFISRAGYFKFDSLPPSRTLYLEKVSKDVRFSQEAANKELGMFSDAVNNVLNTPSELRALMSRFVRNLDLQEGSKVTPQMFLWANAIPNPFGHESAYNPETRIPEVDELREGGATEQEIGQILGVQAISEPVSEANSNAYIKNVVAGWLMDEAQRGSGAYQQTIMHIPIRMYGQSVGTTFNFGYVTDRHGEMDSVYAVDFTEDHQVGTSRRVSVAPEDKYSSRSKFLIQRLNRVLDQGKKDLQEHRQNLAHNIPSIPPMKIEQKLEMEALKYVRERVEQAEDREKDLNELIPEDILPEYPSFGAQVLDILRKGWTSPPSLGTGETSQRGSVYSDMAMNGGEGLDVISIHTYHEGTYGHSRTSEQEVPAWGGGHYATDLKREVCHLRVKTRIAKVRNEDGELVEKKIMAIEEIQSDWTSAYRGIQPTSDEMQAFVDKHGLAVIKAMRAANAQWGWTMNRNTGAYGTGTWQELLIDSAEVNEADWDVSEMRRVLMLRDSHESYLINTLLSTTPVGTTLFMENLERENPSIAKELALAKEAQKKMEPNFSDNPWLTQYHVLALRAAVGWARENGYHAVTWPEGSKPARIYGNDSYIGTMVGTYKVNIDTLDITGYKYLRAPTEALDDTFLGNIIRRSSMAKMFPYVASWNTDQLQEIVEDRNVDGGFTPNRGIADRALQYVREYYQDGASEAARRELDKRVAGDPDMMMDHNNQIVLALKEERLYNSRLHKLLYNQLIPAAAKEIAYGRRGKPTKGQQKAGVASVGKLYIEDTHHPQITPTPAHTQADLALDPTRISGGDMETRPLSEIHDSSRPWARSVAMFGRAGNWLRADMRDAWLRRSGTLRYYITPEEKAEWRRLSNEYNFSQLPIVQPEDMYFYAAQHYEESKPFNGLMTFYDSEAGDNRLVSFPFGAYGDGWMAERGENFQYDIHGVDAALVYKFAYDYMKNIWGIENPNPFKLHPSYIITLMYKPFWNRITENAENFSSDSVEYSEGTQRRTTLGQMEREEGDRYVNEDRENDFPGYMNHDDGGDPSLYRIPWFNYIDTPDGDMPPLRGFRYPKPNPSMMGWLQANAQIKTDVDAALVLATMMEGEDKEEFNALKERLLAGEFEAVSGAWNKLIPREWQPNRGGDEEAGKAPYGLEEGAPEPRPEQVWQAIFMDDNVQNRKLYMPFSLRKQEDTSDDDALQIVYNKIARSNAQMSVKDRVTHWLHRIQDEIKTGDLYWGIKQGMVDEAASVKRYERSIYDGVLDASKSAYKMMHLTKNLPSVMAAIAKAGIPVLKDGVFQPRTGRKGFIEILRPLYEHPQKDLLDLWEGYAVARRSFELIQQTNKDGTSREKLFNQEEIDRLLELEKKYPIFKTVFEEWTNFNNQLLNLGVQVGVLSERERQAWSENAYVPFYRAMEDVEGVGERTGGGMIKGGVSGQHHGIKRLRGGEQKLGSVVENMWFNTASLIDKIYKNEAMSRVVTMLDGVAMQQVELPWEAVKTTNMQLANALKRAGLLTGDAVAQVKAMSSEQKLHWNHIFRRVKPTGDNIVSVMRDGKLQYYEVADEALLRTLQGMGPQDMAGLMKVMGMSKSLLTKMITVDPAFMLANWMRDTLSAWVTSDANFVPVTGSIAAMGDVFKEQGTYIKMMMSGAGGGGFYDLSGGNIAQALDDELSRGGRHWIKKAWKGYMKVGAASENSNRLAIANRIIRNGGTVAEGMYQAQDIMNFTMSGDYAAIRFLIRTVPFLNARMQGIYRLGRGAKEHPVGFMIKGMALTAASMALLAKNWDDDDYENTEEWMKDIYWNFFVDGMHYSIPKPFEVGLLFATLPERLVRLIAGRDDLEVSGKALMRGIGETLAFNPVPQLFKPMIEQFANTNMFTWNPIVNLAMSGREYAYQSSPWTSEVSKRIGSVMPEFTGPAQSPIRIEQLIRGYTGTVGLYAMGAGDALLRSMTPNLPSQPSTKWYERPVIRRIVKGETETTRYNKYEEKLYEVIDASNKAQSTYNDLLRQGRYEKAQELAGERKHLINEEVDPETGQPLDREAYQYSPRGEIMRVRTELRNIRAEQRAILWSMDMDAEAKRKALDALTIAKNAVLTEASSLLDTLDQIKDLE